MLILNYILNLQLRNNQKPSSINPLTVAAPSGIFGIISTFGSYFGTFFSAIWGFVGSFFTTNSNQAATPAPSTSTAAQAPRNSATNRNDADIRSSRNAFLNNFESRSQGQDEK